jgi:membrane peptidoglycan carboxypeptidase
MSVARPSIKSIVRILLRVATSTFDRKLQRTLEQSSSQLAALTGLPRNFLYFLLVIEDKRFGRHIGVDPIAILRASLYNFGFAPKRPHGASTLTQQIYSSTLRVQSKYQPSISYKFRQALWALGTTIIETKAAVLKRYSESVYFGKRLYGFTEAANFYCGLTAVKHCRRLLPGGTDRETQLCKHRAAAGTNFPRAHRARIGIRSHCRQAPE